MEIALSENLQREDINPVEEAEGIRSLMDEFGYTQKEAARKNFEIRLVDPEVVELARALNRIRKNGGQTNLEDWK